MIIEIEGGKRLEVPDGSTPEQIDEVIGDFQGTTQKAEGFDHVKNLDKLTNLGLKYAQGRTFGVAPKVMSGVGAVMAKPVLETLELASDIGLTPNKYEAPPVADLTKQIYGGFKDKLNQAETDNPILSAIAEGAGGIKTGFQAGNTKIGQGVSNWVAGDKLPQGASLAQRAANLLKRAGKSALVGEAGYRAYKAGTSDLGEEMVEAVSGPPIGGIVGSAAPVISASVAGLTPAIDDGLKQVGKLAQKYKIPLSVDQITQTKPIKNIQKVSQELPFSGQDAFRDKQLGAFNKAITKSFGQDSDRITPELMNKAFKEVGEEFDALGRGQTFQLGPQFDDQIKSILDDAEISYTQEGIQNFNKALEMVRKNVKEDGTITGEALGFVRSKLNKLARKATTPDTQELLHDLENAVIDVMTAGDDAAKGALSQAKYRYKNLLAVEPLAQKAKGGHISPSQLNNRVAKIYGRQFTTGQAGELGELARIGNELLPELGGSDTIQKGVYLGGTIAGLTNPKTMIPTAMGLGANRGMQEWINRNPELIRKLLEDEFAKRLLAPPSSVAGSLGAAAGSAVE